MSETKVIEPEYVYMTIPAEYVCVYHRILAMLADYGKDMLEDCKASCKDRNSGVIECFNMFNSAVAARKLGDQSLANAIITYIKAKINQIYRDKDNSTSVIFPVDENGEIKAFVSCGENPKFEINTEDGELYTHKFGDGFSQHFSLSEEDFGLNTGVLPTPDEDNPYTITLTPRYETSNGKVIACADISIEVNGVSIPVEKMTGKNRIDYYFDDKQVTSFSSVGDVSVGVHKFTIVVHISPTGELALTSPIDEVITKFKEYENAN